MGKVRILSDSTCDLTKAQIEKHEIGIIPLCIIMDDKSYYDGLEVTPSEIFAWSNKNKTTQDIRTGDRESNRNPETV